MSRTQHARARAFARGTFGSVALLAAIFGAAACSGGGGGDAGGGPGGAFEVESVNVAPGQTWRINRAIELTFSQPVDFDSVNLNTVSIASSEAGPAVGEFRLDPARPRVVLFQPACPTRADLADAGLVPGGKRYRIDVATRSTGASTVRSAGGAELAVGAAIEFATPVTLVPSELFLDAVPGPVSPILGAADANGVVTGTRFVPANGEPPIPFELVGGVGVLPDPAAPGGELAVPLNFYSELDSRFSVVVELDQPVNPEAANVSADRVRFEFLQGGAWQRFGTEVRLLANCTESGSTLELRPLGVLPRDRALRVTIGAELEDLVGDRNVLPLVHFATMRTRPLEGAGGAPVDSFADEQLETFASAAFEDTDTVLATQRAAWGPNGLLAAQAFAGSGGPGGDFDWHVPPNTELVFDTSSSVILGGPGGVPTTFQLAVGGRVDVRNLFVPSTSILRIQGPNPARIACSGTARIDGRIRVNGGNAQPVFNLNAPTLPETGAAGNGGGGDGGVGSISVLTITTRGGAGNGPFNTTFAGGQGGESGWHPDGTSSGVLHRAAGGGGGTLGRDVVRPNGCVDQTMIGLDAESGFPGATTANAAERPGEQMPWGGMPATLLFDDEDAVGDEFLGVLRRSFGTTDEELVQGELLAPTPGSGGGGGGDGTRATTYPPPALVGNDTDKGAGGGGGAGALTILALGDIVLGPNGRVEAIGGHGTGGESTNGVNRVGGGSGGGSGGHLILQTASRIDLSQVNPGTVAIVARGGQGGAGAGNAGGADATEISPNLDAKHVGTTGPGDLGDNPYLPMVPTECQSGTGVVRGAGGDGGPGIVQLHVGALPTDVVYPGGGDASLLAGAVRPPPVGYELESGSWVDQLLPPFGRFSRAQSKWIALGAVALEPGSDLPQPIAFLFGGTDPETGLLLREGDGLARLDPLLAPAAPIEAPGLPSVDPADPRRLWMDASELVDDDAIYRHNPNLLRRFLVRVGAVELEVESASYEAGEDRLALVVSSAGPAVPASGAVELVPRYVAVSTGGSAGLYPVTAEIRVEFQAARANALGQPDAASVFPGDASPETGGWARGASAFDVPESATFRFYRFRVTFDLRADGGELDGSTPRPTLDFLRLPFRF